MVTITDQPEVEYGFPSFVEFLRARESVRAGAARDLEIIRDRKQRDTQRLRDSYAQQVDALSTAKVGLVDRGRLRLTLEGQLRKDLKAISRSHDVEADEIRRRYGVERSPRAQQGADFRDYMHAATAHREDVDLAERHGLPNPGFDPVLVHLPQVRRRRDNGWLVYETPDLYGLAGQRELLRCNSHEIIVRGADDDRVRAALLVASERYAPPLRISGSEKFMARARTIASDLGIDVADGAEQKHDSTPQATSTAENTEHQAPAREPSATASQDDSTPEIVAAPPQRDPDLDFSVDAATLKKYAKGFGKSFIVPATSDKIKGTVLAWFTDVWSHSSALLVGCNERTAVLVPIRETSRPDLDIGDSLELTRGDDGRFALRNLDREAKAAAKASAEPAAEVEDEPTPETPAEGPELASARGSGGRGGR